MNKPAKQSCSTCGKDLPDGAQSPFFPFCSKRCKMADLNRWFTGDYKISEPIPYDLEDDESNFDTDPRPQ